MFAESRVAEAWLALEVAERKLQPRRTLDALEQAYWHELQRWTMSHLRSCQDGVQAP